MNNNILLIGSTSVGKSTFVNAIVQKNLLQMGVKRITTCKCKVIDPIRYLLETKDIPEELKKDESLGVLNQLELVDLPGYNENEIEYFKKYYNEIKDALGIICIFTKDNIEKSINIVLKKIFEARSHLTHKNIHIILNQTDKLSHDEIIKNIKNIESKIIQNNLDVKNIIPVSSLYGLLPKLYHNTIKNCEMSESKLSGEQLDLLQEILYGEKNKKLEEIEVNLVNNLYDSSNFNEVIKLLTELSSKVKFTKRINIIENIIRYINEKQESQEKIIPNNVYRLANEEFTNMTRRNKITLSVALLGTSISVVTLVTIGTVVVGGLIGGLLTAGILSSTAGLITSVESTKTSYIISNLYKHHIDSITVDNILIDKFIKDNYKDTLEMVIDIHDSLRLFNKAEKHHLKIEGYFNRYQLNKNKNFSIVIIDESGNYISYTHTDL